MKKWVKNLTVLFFLLALTVAGRAGVSQAENFGHGHRCGVDMKLIASLGLSPDEQTALKAALANNGSAVMNAWKTLRAAKKQLDADLNAANPDGNKLAADAGNVSAAKAALKSARGQLNSALLAALTPDHANQLQAQLTAQFQSRLDAKTGHLLFSYARSLGKQ